MIPALLLFPILTLALHLQPRSRTGVTEHVTLNLRPGISLETTGAEVQEGIFQIVGSWSGFQDGYWGLEIGDSPSTAYWFFNWDSVASHQEFAQSPEYPATIEDLESLASSFSAPHVPLQPFTPGELFSSPVVSWVTFNITGVANSTATMNWEETANSFLRRLTGVSGYRTHSSGWEVEDSGVFSLLVGWESTEALGAYVISRKFGEDFRRLVSGVAWEHKILRVAGYVPKL
jgi:heme-degrading monooxygenase HmoA